MLQKSIFLNTISQYNLPIMKDLLYLKDEQIKDFIQLLFMLIGKQHQIQEKFWLKNFWTSPFKSLKFNRKQPRHKSWGTNI